MLSQQGRLWQSADRLKIININQFQVENYEFILGKNYSSQRKKYIVCKYVKDHLFVYSFCPFDDAKVDIKKAPEAGATDY